jgi:hypothetical protein
VKTRSKEESRKGECHGISADEGGCEKSSPGDPEHSLALVESHDLALQVARERARLAGDIQSQCRRKRRDSGTQSLQLPGLLVVRGLLGRLVVLSRTLVVVLLHVSDMFPSLDRFGRALIASGRGHRAVCPKG